MRRIPAHTVICLASLLAACTQKTLSPTTFASQYQPQLDNADVVKPKNCATVAGLDVENGLPNAVVGQRSLQSRAVPAQNISMTGNLAAWVRAGSAEMLRRATLDMHDAKGPRLQLRLDEMAVHENVYVNSGYDARVTLDAALVNARGQVCWHQSVTGQSSNYGDSGAAVNYQETVNHALDRAVMSLVADRGFQEAACRSCRD